VSLEDIRADKMTCEEFEHMARKKRYNGYKSFEYLEPGIDYKVFKLAKEINRVESYVVPVTREQEQKVQEILDNDVVVSVHEHIYITTDDISELLDYKHTGRNWTGYEGLSNSGIDVVIENFMDGSAVITSHSGWKWTDIIHDLGIRFSDFAHQDMIYKAETFEDLLRAKTEGRIALVACIESATPIENEVDRVDVLYGLGVRMMGITYSESNGLGSGLKEVKDGGLTKFGRKVVRRMNQLGMTIDVSHCGDRTAMDVIEFSEKPVLMSHCGARALWNTPRLMPDDVLKACAEKGGVIGIEAAPHTTLTHKHPLHSIESFIEHVEYVADLVGIDHVAFGPDTNFGDHVGLHRHLRSLMSIGDSHRGETYEEVEYVKGLENPGESFPNIIRWMVKHGYVRKDISRVLGKNALRVLEETWAR
jgi:membrane dipeptidase